MFAEYLQIIVIKGLESMLCFQQNWVGCWVTPPGHNTLIPWLLHQFTYPLLPRILPFSRGRMVFPGFHPGSSLGIPVHTVTSGLGNPLRRGWYQASLVPRSLWEVFWGLKGMQLIGKCLPSIVRPWPQSSALKTRTGKITSLRNMAECRPSFLIAIHFLCYFHEFRLCVQPSLPAILSPSAELTTQNNSALPILVLACCPPTSIAHKLYSCRFHVTRN